MTTNPDQLELIVQAVVRAVLDDCPALLPNDRRYADEGGQRLAKDQVSERIARELRGMGVLPMITSEAPGTQVYHAVAFVMGQMRKRMLRPIKRGDYLDAERKAYEEIACAFFGDLEAQGWRLVRTFLPTQPHSTPR